MACRDMKHKFFEMVDRNLDRNKMVAYATHVPLCSNVKPHLSKLGPMKQSMGKRVAESIVVNKRPRMEEAMETQNKGLFNELIWCSICW